jgi:putative membrane protein
MKKLLVCVSSVLLVAGCASHRTAVGGTEGVETTSEASSAASKGAGARVMIGGSANSQLVPEDTSFVHEAAQAGLAEVNMGNLAMQNAQDQNVKPFAQKLVSDHTAANQELQQIAAQKGMQLPSVMDAREMLTIKRLSSLNGTEFDRAFAQDAVKAHEQAVKLFQQEAQSGQDPELKAFAQKTLQALKEHLAMARQMDSGKHNYNDLNDSNLSSRSNR